jgi:hypothetical protein
MAVLVSLLSILFTNVIWSVTVGLVVPSGIPKYVMGFESYFDFLLSYSSPVFAALVGFDREGL